MPTVAHKAFSMQFSPRLAYLFTSISYTGYLHARFTEELIKVLYAKDDPTELVDYHHITLLNNDYRTVAKLLAARLGPVLNASVAAVKIAGLPGRLVESSNINPAAPAPPPSPRKDYGG